MVIRVTAICIKDNQILLVKEPVQGSNRGWSLPGGKVEEFEQIDRAIIREVQEETGITISPKGLIYISEKIFPDKHIVHILFETEYKSGVAGENQSLTETEKIESAEFVPVTELETKGFSKIFVEIVKNNFPNRGSYVGDKSNIGL